MKLFFPPLFFFFFLSFLCSVDDTVCPPAAINIHERSLILCYSACAAGYNSLLVPVHLRHFLELQARPPPLPNPPPLLEITNSAGWQLCVCCRQHPASYSLEDLPGSGPFQSSPEQQQTSTLHVVSVTEWFQHYFTHTKITYASHHVVVTVLM